MRRFHFKLNLAITYTVIMTLAIFAYSPAKAQVDEAGAEKLRTLFSEYIETNRASATQNGAELVTKGDVEVTPKGSYYAITLPHLGLKMQDGGLFDIGVFALNAMPSSVPGQWKMTVATPTPMVMYDAASAPKLIVNIGEQSFSGIFQEEMKSFVKLKAQYNKFVAIDQDSGMKFLFPSIQYVANMEERTPGQWTGPADIVINGFHVLDEGQTTPVFKIGKMFIKSTVEDYSAKAQIDFQEKMEALTEAMSSVDAPQVSPDHAMAMYNLMTEFFGTAFDAMDFELGVENVHVAPPNEDKEFNLNRAAFGMGMSGFRSNRVKLRYWLNYNGLSVPGLEKEVEDMIPTQMNYDISLNNIPYKEMVDLGRSSMQGIIAQPQASQLIGLQALMTAPQLLTQASSNVSINNTYAGNNIYNVNLNGLLTADINAIKGGYGNGRVEFYGLESLIAMTQKNLENPDLSMEDKQKLQQMYGGLNAMLLFGQQDTDSNGRAIRAYNLELTKEGAILLNGADINTIMK